MYKTKNRIPEANRAQIIEVLNACLATCLDGVLNSKQAHWNVKGPNFISLHELFDEIYASFGEYADLVAERVVQLGGIAEGTVQFVAKKSALKAYPVSIADGHSHVEYLSDTLAATAVQIRKGIDACTEMKDADAADILTEISRGIDKHLWFVEAHLQAPR